MTNPGSGYSSVPSIAASTNVPYIPPGLEGLYKDPFSYNVIFNPSAHGVGVQQQSTQIQNDAYFVCIEQTAWIVDAATGNTTVTSPVGAALLVRVLDTASGKYNTDQPTPIGNIFGTALAPFVWLYRSKVYLPGGQLTVELTNNMAADQIVRFTFSGFKVYNMPDQLNS